MAFDLNATLSPIITGVVEVLPLFLDMVIAMVPIVITLAVSDVSYINSFAGKWGSYLGSSTRSSA